MMIARKLSSSKSKLKPLFTLSFLPHSITNPSFPQHNTSKPNPNFSFFSSNPSNLTPKQQSLPELLLDSCGYCYVVPPPDYVCPGCGIRMKGANPGHHGFFSKYTFGKVFYGYSGKPTSEEVESHLNEKREKLRENPLVCDRCHSLRSHGVFIGYKTVLNVLAVYDFLPVGRRLVEVSDASSVVLLLVDAVDFEGSFPKKVAKFVSDVIGENFSAWKEGESGNVPTMLLVVTKSDILPTSLSPSHLEDWFRQRARECGGSGIKKVHFVSKVKNLGMKSLVDDVVELAGARGNVWLVGMKDSGKKTLINSMRKCAGVTKREVRCWIEAKVLGSVIGIVGIEGVLPGQAKFLDTPGLFNPRQITPRLTWEEKELVRISKKMKPRTYRIEEGHSVHIGGLMRLDIEELSVDSMYVTVWASSLLPLHMGKTENADNVQLQPPIEKARFGWQKLGKWVRHEFRVSGNNWESSSVDIAAGGIGWFAIGLKGKAVVGVWTYEGINVVLRNSLIPNRSKNLEVAGFTVSKIDSKADQALNKAHLKGEKKSKQNEENVVAPTE